MRPLHPRPLSSPLLRALVQPEDGMDKSSLLGVTVAIGGILLGLILEGGRIAQIIQPTAAIIVFGGTLGAVMIQFPLRVIIAATLRLGHVFVDHSADPHA